MAGDCEGWSAGVSRCHGNDTPSGADTDHCWPDTPAGSISAFVGL